MTTDRRQSLEVRATPDCLDEVHNLINTVAAGAGVADEATVRFTTAAIEIVDNVIEHGTRAEAPNLAVTVEVTGGWLRGVVEDDGPPTSLDLGATDMPDAMADRGRGLPLAARLLDEFRFERQAERNTWHLGIALDD